ncbi:ribosome maturation factor RimP [Hamadaea tsunoensis]|uniref:ribosome maturation factor RimP n=1 Tax=Hamadaea tsunoensis TaxID=53368 RepID=UPI000421E2CF|nr:ribosome maturation factor RimP [Hamadaea tsunoensis]
MAQRNRRSAAPTAAPVIARTSPARLTEVRERVGDLVAPLLEAAGYDLEDLAVRQIGRRHQLRVTVDGDGGVNLDTIADLSRLIADALDDAEATGKELVPGEYQLEVSSPGVDRPLTLARHWRRAVGRLVTVKTTQILPSVAKPGKAGKNSATVTPAKASGGTTVTGRVIAADEKTVTLEVAEKKSTTRHVLDLAELGPGHVQVEFSRLEEISDEDLEEIGGDDTGADEHDAGDEDADGLDDEEDADEDVEER